MACTKRREVELKKKSAKTIATSKDPLEIIRAHLFSAGVTGLKSLTRAFKKADKDGSGKLDYAEFNRVITRSAANVDEKLVRRAFSVLDADNDGVISFTEAAAALRPNVAPHRYELIHQAFLKLDRDRSGKVTVEDLYGVYNAKVHPKYLNGEWSEKRVIQEFIKTFDASKDGKISEDEFRDYYMALSTSIDNDAYFDLIMRQAWGPTPH